MPKTPPVDADAQAFLTAAAITDPTISGAINTLVVQMKADNIWSKMKAVYPMVGGTANTHKFNLKDPRDLDAAFRLQFNGGWTHSANGAQSNGTNGWANTFFNPSTNLVFDNLSFGLYSRTQDVSGTKIYGVRDTTLFRDMYHNVSSKLFSTDGNAAVFSYTLTPTTGLINFSRTSNISGKVYSNGVLIATKSTPVVSLMSNANFFLGARSDNNSPIWYNNYQIGLQYISEGLTDTDAANLYTAVQTFQTTLGRSIGTQTISDSDAQAFVTNAAIVDQVEATAVNNLVVGMKADGIWSKMKAIYPFVGGSASAHKWNLTDPRDLDVAFRLGFIGGWTHSVNGALPNGTNGYANTFLVESTFMTTNSNGLGIYLGTNNVASTSDPVDIGAFNSTTQVSLISAKNDYNARVNGDLFAVAQATRLGFYSVQRTSATLTTHYKNGVAVVSGNSGGTLPNIPIYIGNTNLAPNTPYLFGYTNNRFQFAFISDGLNATENSNLYTRVQAFNTALSRQV